MIQLTLVTPSALTPILRGIPSFWVSSNMLGARYVGYSLRNHIALGIILLLRKPYRMPLPRGKALGRARLPLVVWRPVVPRVEVPRVVPREDPEYLGVGFDETVLGGFSTNDVSVVLRHKSVLSAIAADRVAHRKLASPSLDGRICSLSNSEYNVSTDTITLCTTRTIQVPFCSSNCFALRNDSGIGA